MWNRRKLSFISWFLCLMIYLVNTDASIFHSGSHNNVLSVISRNPYSIPPNVDLPNRTRAKRSPTPQVIKGVFDTPFDNSVSRNVSEIYYFAYEFSPQQCWAIRVCVTSEYASANFPILVVARQSVSTMLLNVPLTFPNTKMQYKEVCRTLCPLANFYPSVPAGQEELYVEITTTSPSQEKFTLLVSKITNFVIKTDQPVPFNITASTPIVFEYHMPDYVKSVLVHVSSNDDQCMVFAVQDIKCPLYDTQRTAEYEGFYQTMTYQGGITITRKTFDSGKVYIVMILQPTDEDCIRFGDRNVTNSTMKKAVLTVLFPTTDAHFYEAVFGTLGIYLGFCLLAFFICLYLFISDNNDVPLQPATQPRPQDDELPTQQQGKCACIRHMFKAIRDCDIPEEFRNNSTNRCARSQETGQECGDPLDVAGSSVSQDFSEEFQNNSTGLNARSQETGQECGDPQDVTDSSASQGYQKTEDELSTEEQGTCACDCLRRIFGGRQNNGNPEELQDLGASTGAWSPGTGKNEILLIISVSDLATKKEKRLEKNASIYSWNLATIALFYGLPAFQLVYINQKIVNITGNQDLCYYNFLCSYQLWVFKDFNHVYSNIGYVILGILFILLVWWRDCQNRNCQNRSPDTEENRPTGVAHHSGLFYAMGLALIMEGVLSATYHVCPNKANFQFDTAFMYVICTVSMLKLYQGRHPDVTIKSHSTWIIIGVVLFIGVIGVFQSGLAFWIVFGLCHILATLFISTSIYYMWTVKLDCSHLKKGYQRWKNSCKNENRRCCKPKYCVRFTIVLIAVLFNLGFDIYGFCKQPEDFSTFLLSLFLVNFFLYCICYWFMKVVYGEQIRLIPSMYMILSGILWLVAVLGFFVKHNASWGITPAESRESNKLCLVGNFYDEHDIWHFLSSFALFFSFMAVLTVDDDQKDTPRDKLAVF